MEEKIAESNLEEPAESEQTLKDETPIESPKEKKVVREDDGFGYDFISEKKNNNKN